MVINIDIKQSSRLRLIFLFRLNKGTAYKPQYNGTFVLTESVPDYCFLLTIIRYGMMRHSNTTDGTTDH